MEISTEALKVIFTDAQLAWGDVVAQTPTWYGSVAQTMPSKTRLVSYNWLDRVPQMRKWVGPRVIAQAMAHSRQVLNEAYENTIELNMFDVRDDLLGIFYQAVRQQAQAVTKWPDVVLANFIRYAASSAFPDGTPNLGFDGQPLYSTQHPILGGVDGAAFSVTGSQVQSNLFTGRALTYDNYIYVKTQSESLLGADGLPLGTEYDTLMVPPALEGIGRMIVEADFIPTSASMTTGTAGQATMTNIYKGSAKLLVNRQLADMPNNWWLLSTSGQMKPYLWQLRDAPTFTQLTEPTSWNVFNLAQFLYGVVARGAAAETVWWMSVAATSAASYR